MGLFMPKIPQTFSHDWFIRSARINRSLNTTLMASSFPVFVLLLICVAQWLILCKAKHLFLIVLIPSNIMDFSNKELVENSLNGKGTFPI